MQAVDAQGGAPGGQPTAGLAGVGDVHQPGLGGVPLTPTPPNSVTGMGPGQPATMIAPVGPMPPPTAGVPGGIPNLPQNAQPLPGQQ
jgi:hypothetical protein